MRNVLGKVIGITALGATLALMVNSSAVAVDDPSALGTLCSSCEVETGVVTNEGTSDGGEPGGAICKWTGIWDGSYAACFRKGGDSIFVYDGEGDFHNAYADWDNDLKDSSGTWRRYRSGECWIKAGAYNWVECNKNFYENDTKNALGGYGSRVRVVICIDDIGDPTCKTGDWITNNS